MAIILGIETSCDETAAAVYDSTEKKLVSNAVFSQVALHEKYGGVVPEIASRSHLEKIGFIVKQSLSDASISLEQVDSIAVTNKPGLAGALLVGLCFAKGLAYAHEKKLLPIDHLEAHIFSTFLKDDGTVRDDIEFPHLCLLASGGHTAFFLVHDFGKYELIGQTLDDAAGEAFDKVAKLIGLGYPGGPRIEKFAKQAGFEDFFSYPRTKNVKKSLNFSFSGLKTAVLYDLVKRGAYDLKVGLIENRMNDELREKVASSLLVCISDIMKAKIQLAFKLHPEVKGVTFAGGVACNTFLREELEKFCDKRDRQFIVPPRKFCGDNGAMVAFVGGYKDEAGEGADLSVDVYD